MHHLMIEMTLAQPLEVRGWASVGEEEVEMTLAQPLTSRGWANVREEEVCACKRV